MRGSVRAVARRRARVVAVCCGLGAAALLCLWVAPGEVGEAAHELWAVTSSTRALPLVYAHHRRTYPERYATAPLNASCAAVFPELVKLRHALPFWQMAPLAGGGRLLAFAAHWDIRWEPTVRLLVYSEVAPLPRVYCLLWYYDEGAPQAEPALATYGWRGAESDAPAGASEPYVVACRARPAPAPAPAAVSLVPAPCDAPHNALAVQSAPVPASVRPELPPAPAAPASTPARGASVAVCAVLRDGGGADLTALRLVEWLQLLHQFQVDKVYVYTRQPHPRVEAVLRRYACRGLVDISLLTLPPAVPLTRSPAAGAATEHDPDRGRKHELLPYNDCLYRALSRHAWLLNLQLDEMLVPLREGSLPRLAQAEAGGGGGGEQDEGAADALHFEHFSFPAFAWGARATPAPSLRMLALHRSAHLADTEGGYSVALYRTSSALATLRHTPLRCQRGRGERSGSCRVRRVAAFAARLHRYRAGCGELHARSCAALLEAAESDDTLQRWQHVAQEVDAVLDEIRFGPDL